MDGATLAIALALYAAVVVLLGIVATRGASSSPEEYFLAGRRLGTLVLFMALFGTNATSFVLVEIPGRAYHDGLGVFSVNAPVVAFATPLTFYLIGVPARRMAARLRAVTPAELYAKRFGSPLVGAVLFLFFLAYTLPYMVLAVKGAAVTLENVTGGAVPFAVGAASVIAVALLYTTLGGMRATAWTNVVQGSVFLVFLVVALVWIVQSLGGPRTAMEAVERHDADLLRVTREGLFEPRQWASWGLMISLTVIAFPHMFVRLLAAASERSLQTVCRIYPLALVVLWLVPVLIGVFGAAEFPGLEGRESDEIYGRMITAHLPQLLAAVGFVAVLAAVMSTLDAQILTLSSMLTRDVLDRFLPGEAKRDVRSARVFGLGIAALVLVLSIVWGESVFGIASVAFSGYVTLTPTLYLGVTWKRFNKQAALASVLSGSAALYLGLAGAIPTLGFMPGVFGFATALVVALVVPRFTRRGPAALDMVAFGFRGR